MCMCVWGGGGLEWGPNGVLTGKGPVCMCVWDCVCVIVCVRVCEGWVARTAVAP